MYQFGVISKLLVYDKNKAVVRVKLLRYKSEVRRVMMSSSQLLGATLGAYQEKASHEEAILAGGYLDCKQPKGLCSEFLRSV